MISNFRFLNEHGAWFMVHTWLADALQSRNTPLLIEVLDLLQLCPITDARLKDADVTNLLQTRLKYPDLAQMVQSIAQEYDDQSECGRLEVILPSVMLQPFCVC